MIDQIKAGEVVERPSGLVKEILENALDAGASKIHLTLSQDGLDLIRCQDNGGGMSFFDLPEAFKRHTTSKIKYFEDLYSLQTFGFRGEALTSIASVSRLTCLSSPQDVGQGGRIEIQGGEMVSHLPFEGRRPGTTLIIRDLFYNTPARLKFIRSRIAERNSLKRIFSSFLLSHPEVEFSLSLNTQEKEIYPQISDLRERISQIFFKKSKEKQKFFSFEGSSEGHFLHGQFSAFPPQKGVSSHFFFVNGRMFQDRHLHQIFLKSLERLWPRGESGLYLCFIKAPPDLIDVNIHPQKTQIKFVKYGLIQRLLGMALKRSQEEQIREISLSPPKDFSLRLEDMEKSLDRFSLGGRFQNTTKEEGIYILSSRFYLEKRAEGQILTHFPPLLFEYLKKNLSFDLQESEISPLLISEAFSFSPDWDFLFPEFKSLGFELERVSQKTVLLKTLPRCFSCFEPGPLFRTLFFERGTAPPSSLKALLEECWSKFPMAHFSFLRPTFSIHESFQKAFTKDFLALHQRPLSDSFFEGLFEVEQ